MKKIFSTIAYLVVAILVGVTVAYAGNLTPPGAPAQSMKKLSDLYELVDTGSNTPDTSFTTPGSVSPTMHSIGDIYDTLASKISAIDASSIKNGVSIFGVTGSYDTESSNPITAGTVSTGKIGWVNGTKITGTLAPSSLPAPLLKTGQTTCWDATGTAVACAGTGQDGNYLKGVTKAYTVSNGMVTDTNTGLMWKQCSEGQSLSANNCQGTGSSPAWGATTMLWAPAITTCEADTTGGYTDWRLPNRFELESIVNLQNVSPAIDTTTFPNTQSNNYWSSSTFAGSPANAWFVSFSTSNAGSGAKSSFNYYVRCVRG